jgi:hypothetical protein
MSRKEHVGVPYTIEYSPEAVDHLEMLTTR